MSVDQIWEEFRKDAVDDCSEQQVEAARLTFYCALLGFHTELVKTYEKALAEDIPLAEVWNRMELWLHQSGNQIKAYFDGLEPHNSN